MKRIKFFVSLLLASVMFLSCSGCVNKPSSGGTGSEEDALPKSRYEEYSQQDYLLYQNIFYNNYAKDFVGTRVKKVGVFAILHDAFNDVERCYVLGYADQTKCCDWQWEFVPPTDAELPPVGSLVTVEGTFTYDEENALDKYWITDTTLKLKKKYEEKTYEINMYVMSDTLERVQIVNVKRFPDVFENKVFVAYGRIKGLGTLQDPIFDGSWEIDFVWDGSVPNLGTTVVLTGTFSSDGKLNVSAMKTID